MQKTALNQTKPQPSYNTKTKRQLCKMWNVKQNYFEIILKLFQSFISHATTSETEMKWFQTDVDEGGNNYEIILFHT